MAVTEQDLRQYELAIQLMSEESNRNWNRFSVLVGSEIVLMAAVLAGEKDVSSVVPTWWMKAPLLLMAVAVVGVVFSGARSARAARAIVTSLEWDSEYELRLLHLGARGYSRRLWWVNSGLMVAIAGLVALLWGALLLAGGG